MCEKGQARQVGWMQNGDPLTKHFYFCKASATQQDLHMISCWEGETFIRDKSVREGEGSTGEGEAKR